LPTHPKSNDYIVSYPTGLQNGSSFPALSYTDSKTVRTKLSAQLRSTLQPIAELGDKMREEFPDAFGGLDADLSDDQKEILRLEDAS